MMFWSCRSFHVKICVVVCNVLVLVLVHLRPEIGWIILSTGEYGSFSFSFHMLSQKRHFHGQQWRHGRNLKGEQWRAVPPSALNQRPKRKGSARGHRSHRTERVIRWKWQLPVRISRDLAMSKAITSWHDSPFPKKEYVSLLWTGCIFNDGT